MTTTFRSGLGRRFARLTVAGLVATFVLVGCSDDAEPDPSPATTTQAAPTPEEEVEAAHRRYWEVYAELAGSGEIDPGAFSGVAEGTFLELRIKGLRDQVDAGVLLTGGPEFTGFEIEIDGATATSFTCVDYSSWKFIKDGEEDVSPEGAEPVPSEATLERRDDGWIVTDSIGREGAECP